MIRDLIPQLSRSRRSGTFTGPLRALAILLVGLFIVPLAHGVWSADAPGRCIRALGAYSPSRPEQARPGGRHRLAGAPAAAPADLIALEARESEDRADLPSDPAGSGLALTLATAPSTPHPARPEPDPPPWLPSRLRC